MREKNIEIVTPQVRFGLKAAIVGAGYRYNEFARRLKTHPSRLSRIMSGAEFPSPTMQRAISRELGLTLRELRSLL